jgi:putative intracellular protease/amidase
MHLDIIAQNLPPASTQRNATLGAWGEQIIVTTTFDEIVTSQKQLDVLLIPGGGGTRASMEAEIAFVKTMFPKVLSP